MTVSPLDRLIVGVATGDLTLEDLEKFVGDIIAGGILPYRVIVDIAASKPRFTASQLEAFAAAVFVLEKDKHPGPVAIVTGDEQAELAEQFARMPTADRATHVFSSIHQARRWLAENTEETT